MYRPLFIILILFIFSCTKKEKSYTQAQLNKNVDSIVETKIPALQQQAAEDFKNRLPIELKFKVDSILNVSYDIPTAPELESSPSNLIKENVDSDTEG